MSGLAEIALEQGFVVEGSDMVRSNHTAELISRGAVVHIGHDLNNIPDDTDMVIYSAAINDKNPDMIRAKELNIPLVERSVYLGYLSNVFDETIGVAGTHGKTTTSSMVSELLDNDGRKPCVSIGSRATYSNSDYLVIESCEFVDSFLETSHNIGIITNIEEDHLDYFTGGLPQIKESFHKFGMILPKDGIMICYGDSQDVLDSVQGLKCDIMTYGFGPRNDLIAKNVFYNDMGQGNFDVYYKGDFYGNFSLHVPGEHNVLNALSVVGVSIFMGISKDVLIRTLAQFKGADRRFTLIGDVDGVKIYEDYAHHPTELKVVVDCALKLPHNTLWVVFQPHTYSRTHFFFEEFTDAFAKADQVILNDIYSDREPNKWGVSSEQLAENVSKKYHLPAEVITEFDDIVSTLSDKVKPGDIVLVAGSQTINKVAFMLTDKLRNK